jgi:peptidoglycan/xylan/chitin deacetylase (PgdA/CDA1 family)
MGIKPFSIYPGYTKAMKQSLKHTAIRAALCAISTLQLGRIFPGAAGRGAIFTLHHVRPKVSQNFEPNAHLEITPEFLEQAILAAKEAGLTPVHLTNLPNLLADGDSTARYVCFTLDDGYRNNARHAAPVFRKHNVPYTIFICPGFVERKRSMWWETVAVLLQENSSTLFDFGSGIQKYDTSSILAKHATFGKFANLIATTDENEAVARIDALAISFGIDPLAIVEREIMNEAELRTLSLDQLCTLGGHTMTHCNLARVSTERLAAEIQKSCSLVARYSGKTVETFAYPYGWSHAAGTREFEEVKKQGIKIGVTTRPGIVKNVDNSNMSSLHRISLNGFYQDKKLISALLTGIAFKRR